jgi:hypothetical protein
VRQWGDRECRQRLTETSTGARLLALPLRVASRALGTGEELAVFAGSPA